MSCWHNTTLLRIPVSALGYKYLREWQEFAEKHKDDFRWEKGCFCESLSEDYPWGLGWGEIEFYDPDWDLGQRDPNHPEIVPGPFLDYYLEDEYPLNPEYNSFGENNEVSRLDEDDAEYYLPRYQRLFPHFTLKDMEAVRKCIFEWYDGTCAPYLYSEWDDDRFRR